MPGPDFQRPLLRKVADIKLSEADLGVTRGVVRVQ